LRSSTLIRKVRKISIESYPDKAHKRGQSPVNISFYDQSTTDWVSISGTAQVSNDKERIKAVFHPSTKAWFGDLEDGVHNGGPEDPRVSLIQVLPSEVRYVSTVVDR
jgi:general stress protein 26